MVRREEINMNGRGLLEIVKATGYADIAPGYKMFTRKYLVKGRIIDLDSTHRVEITGDDIFHTPFVFVAASEVSGGEPDIAGCENDEKAVFVIEAINRLGNTGRAFEKG
jgi:hypothetical protein